MRPSKSENGLRKSFLGDFSYWLFMVAAVWALTVPFFGPMLDHHFVERQPYHDHIYFSPEGSDHIHFYEDHVIHPHLHPASRPKTGEVVDGATRSADVLYLTATDGAGQNPAAFATTALHADLAYPELDDGYFRLGLTDRDRLPPEAVIPPPKKPPRA
jgi:hypothetical protein